MRKLMLLAAMLAMVLAAAAPAFGQTVEGGDVQNQGGVTVTGNENLVQVCQQFFTVQNQVAPDIEQTQTVS